jgi:hypothetical protein
MIIHALLTHCGLDVVIHAISLGVFFVVFSLLASHVPQRCV